MCVYVYIIERPPKPHRMHHSTFLKRAHLVHVPGKDGRQDELGVAAGGGAFGV